MSDRILVMREGRQMGILGHDEATQEAVMSLATGEDGGPGASRATADDDAGERAAP